MPTTHRQKFKTIRHFHQPGDCHELTFSCYEHLPLLTNDTWRELLADSIDKALETHGLCLSAYVFMPEHVHLLVWPEDPRQANISEFLKMLKLSCSTKIKRRLVAIESSLVSRLMVRERPGKTSFRFWQEGPGYDRNLEKPSTVLASIDYIHQNPVKRGLCQQTSDWFWSSARHYLDGVSLPVPTKPRWTPLPAEYLTGT